MPDSHTPWDGTERRKSPRLRRIIDELQEGVRENRSIVTALAQQIAHLKDDVDTLKYRLRAPAS
jgi:hypothetical protein